MPDEKGKLYRYTITIRDANRDFKDVRFDPLYTSFEDYNMAINVMKPTYKENETITLMVENWGPNHITCSMDWKIYKKKIDEWEKVAQEEEKGPFTDIGHAIIPSAWNMDYLDVDDTSVLLIPGNHVRIVLDRFSLKKGQYKLVGKLGSSENRFLLEDEFEVIK
ncbi:immunoglobulin-like domain-containing protein [Paenisporosarcina indica]|uniref:immunoglobulin-like domain-containing protein n=1 Tax=Paenisporosarcina indica TaxID=650093 RepID=UPI0013723991|nr:immunoglobulin-like domain-containing protein [Paenisporosarcina indica]